MILLLYFTLYISVRDFMLMFYHLCQRSWFYYYILPFISMFTMLWLYFRIYIKGHDFIINFTIYIIEFISLFDMVSHFHPLMQSQTFILFYRNILFSA